MSLQPLPIEILVAAKLRRQAKELILLAEELEASAPQVPRQPVSEFKYSKENMKKRKS